MSKIHLKRKLVEEEEKENFLMKKTLLVLCLNEIEGITKYSLE